MRGKLTVLLSLLVLGAAIHGSTTAPVAAAGFTDSFAIPLLKPEGRNEYESFLSEGKRRAFAISPGGDWGYAAGRKSVEAAKRAALDRCRKRSQGVCALYALDDRIVFDAGRWPTLWRPYKTAAEAMRSPIGREPGQRFADIVFQAPNGELKKLSEFRGKVVVLHFWAASGQHVRWIMAALPPFDPAVWPNRSEFAEGEAEYEFQKGNFPRSVKYMKWAIEAIPGDYRAGRSGRFAKLAIYHARAGNFDAADEALSTAQGYAAGVGAQAMIWDNPTGAAWFEFQVDAGRAAILASKGELERAEALQRKGIEILKKGKLDRIYTIETIHAETDLTMNLMRQGRLVEAESVARDVLRRTTANFILPAHVSASVLVRLTQILFERGRFDDSENLARAAVDLYGAVCASEGSLGLAVARDILGKSLVAQQRWKEALGQYEAIREGMAGDATTFQSKFAGNLDWAVALLYAGRAEDAGNMLRTALLRHEKRLGKKHYRTAEARGFLAMVRVATGDLDGAGRDFASAVKILLTRSRQADDESSTFAIRDRRLQLILESYMELLAGPRSTATDTQAAVAESFRLANAARGRSVQRALSASAARAASGDPALADLVRREQDAQKQIAALYGLVANLVSLPTAEQNPAVVHDLRIRIDRLRTARGALAGDIATRFPEYSQLINPAPATVDDGRAALRSGEALISTYVGADRTFVWAIPKSGRVAFASVPLGRAELADRVALLRSALEPNATSLGDIPEFDVAVAYDLYEALLEPVEGGWRDADSLLVVAHGPLGYLPLALLPTLPASVAPEGPLFAGYRDIPWLARSHAVTVLPSVASLRALRALPAGDPARHPFVGFGDPYFSKEQETAAARPRSDVTLRGLRLRSRPRTEKVDSAQLAMLPRLPDTAAEVTGIARALGADPKSSLYLGVSANEGTVKRLDLSAFKVIAFATHGLVAGDLDGLTQPALALTSPVVPGGDDDGLLTMGEILGLRLDADWAVLSACNTGSGQGAGAEAVSGLGRAFFYAGTRALLVSNWPVETTSAKALTTDLFRRQAADPSLGRADALRRAMLSLVDGDGFKDASGKTVFSYAHPIFWAPFSLVGDPGGAKKVLN